MADDVRVLRNLTRQTVLAERVESANSLWARFRGLMGRAALAADEGLWLPGTNGVHMFFMRFAIDAVFVGEPGEDSSMPVLATREALPPWTGIVPLVWRAKGVAELPVGTIRRTGTAVGDRIRLEERAL
jgi:uncharacterized membrane protein (UPF0127 family)